MATTEKSPSLRRVWLGREREVADLEVALGDVRAGRGGLFLVTGEPGIGKTRLCDELGQSAIASGVAVHWGRAWEAGGAPPYWPFIQVLRSISRTGQGEAPDLERGLAHASGDRFELFDAVGSFLQAVASRGPLLVVLDDLHAADPSSLLLLHFLVRDLRSRAVLMIGTYREAEARLSPEIARILAQVAREASMLRPRRLDRAQVQDFVAQATGSAPTADRVTSLHRLSEGNPLFLREMLQLGGATGLAPEGIREVVRARLSLLAPAARHVLEGAAVLGREFLLQPLAAVTDMAATEVDALLTPAVEAGIVERLDGADALRFTHILLREGFYEALPATRRTALHRAAAAALTERAGDPPLAELAHHLLCAIPAVPARVAAEAALLAAERAMKILAFEDACALLVRTAALLHDAVGEELLAFEVLLGLGVARIRAGDVRAGKDACLQAMARARRLGDGERFARAVLGGACEFVPNVRDRPLIAQLEEALSLLRPGDGPLRARCMAQLAAERQPEPDTAAPIALARDAVAMARRLEDAASVRFALSLAGLSMLAFGDPGERRRIDQECLRLALSAGDELAALRAHLLLASDLQEEGDPAGAAAHAHAYEALVQLRHRSYRWVVEALGAQRALWDGRFDDAARSSAAFLALWQEDEGRGVEMLAFPVGFARASEREVDRPALEARLRAGFGALREDLGSCVGEMLIAQLHARAGDAARTAAQLAVVRAHPLFDAVTEGSWLALLAEPCHLVGDVALAELLHAALLPRAHRFFWLGPLGSYFEPPYTRQLGLLAQTLGRPDEAVAHLADAEARTARAGMRSHLARVRHELAGALMARGAAGDRARAIALIDAAQELAAELGQAGLLPVLAARGAEARASTAAASAPPPCVTARPAFGLSREGDVWSVVSGARTLRLRDSRGLHLLAHLVANPGQELHVLQLVGGGEGVVDAGDAGPLLDAEVVQRYRRRLLDLREDLEEAEGFADAGRADRARQEIDALTRELARAVGLGGRERRAGGAAERARTTVQKRLRAAIQRIEEGLPELGVHLQQAVRTGTFCGYLPEGRRARRT